MKPTEPETLNLREDLGRSRFNKMLARLGQLQDIEEIKLELRATGIDLSYRAKSYDTLNTTCPLARYFQACGFSDAYVAATRVYPFGYKSNDSVVMPDKVVEARRWFDGLPYRSDPYRSDRT